MDFIDISIIISCSFTIIVLFLIPIVLLKIKKLPFNMINGSFSFYSVFKALWLLFSLLTHYATSETLALLYYNVSTIFLFIFTIALMIFLYCFKGNENRFALKYYILFLVVAIMLFFFNDFISVQNGVFNNYISVQHDEASGLFIGIYSIELIILLMLLLTPPYIIGGTILLLHSKSIKNDIIKRRIVLLGLTLMAHCIIGAIGNVSEQITMNPYVGLLIEGLTTPIIFMVMLYAMTLKEK